MTEETPRPWSLRVHIADYFGAYLNLAGAAYNAFADNGDALRAFLHCILVFLIVGYVQDERKIKRLRAAFESLDALYIDKRDALYRAQERISALEELEEENEELKKVVVVEPSLKDRALSLETELERARDARSRSEAACRKLERQNDTLHMRVQALEKERERFDVRHVSERSK